MPLAKEGTVCLRGRSGHRQTLPEAQDGEAGRDGQAPRGH